MTVRSYALIKAKDVYHGQGEPSYMIRPNLVSLARSSTIGYFLTAIFHRGAYEAFITREEPTKRCHLSNIAKMRNRILDPSVFASVL